MPEVSLCLAYYQPCEPFLLLFVQVYTLFFVFRIFGFRHIDYPLVPIVVLNS